LSADAEPGTFERTVAARLLRLSIPPEAERQKNPYSDDTSAWQAALAHYDDHCATCHGSDGRGHTELGENMYPKVPDFADPAIQRLSDGALFAIIQNGVRWTGMPAWKREHSAEDTWKLVSFVRQVPSLTATDLEGLRQHRERENHAPRQGDDHNDHKHPGASDRRR
jgi:mono/diheme cytochrome c family protein